MKIFCYETFLDPEGMTKADLLVAIGSFMAKKIFLIIKC